MQHYQKSRQNRICCKVAYLLDGKRCNFGDTHDCKFLEGSNYLNVEELRTIIRKEKG